ncbi:TPA: replication initiation protein, partial [Enterococcus faecium]|nr:replication initiation protein [Enterococcus faecium]
MSNDIVRYNNGLNSVPLRKFTPIDMDLFWGICSKMKRKGTKEEIFTFKQIKELIDYNINARGDRFANDLIKMSKKIITLSFIYEDEKTYEQLNLFQKFKIDKVNETLLIKVSEEFEYILNSIGTNFTRFELEN